MDRWSEAPDQSGGSAVIVLRGAAVVTAEVIALQAPGEILEVKFVVGAAAHSDGEGIVDEAVGIDVADSGHGLHERAPFSVSEGKARAADEDVLSDPLAEIAAAVGHQ